MQFDPCQLPHELHYKPSAFFFRQALRESKTRAQAVRVAMQVVRELEALKAFIRSQGMIPPKRFVLRSEVEAKGWTAEA